MIYCLNRNKALQLVLFDHADGIKNMLDL